MHYLFGSKIEKDQNGFKIIESDKRIKGCITSSSVRSETSSCKGYPLDLVELGFKRYKNLLVFDSPGTRDSRIELNFF